MARDVSNSNDYLDVRDIIERFEELEGERQELVDGEDEKLSDLAEWDEDCGEEFKLLQNILSELEGSGGDYRWRGSWYPVTLIRDSYFVEAMEEFVKDIGDLPTNTPYYLEIDWEKTADNLRVDYSSIEYDGVTYWFR